MKIQSRLKGAAAPIALSIALLAQPAFAQDNTSSTDQATASSNQVAPADDNAIIVTGSRIARSKYDTVQPVQTVSSEQIEARGFDTLGQALNELPAFGVPDNSTIGIQSSYGPGQSFVNFFGLGSQRTLTLVNGRRFVGSNTSSIFGPTGQGGDQVDLNLIPTKLIDRVETVAVGGAPIYGSDAIAGTINVILKKDYQGFDIDGDYGASVAHNDARDYRVRVLAGHNFLDGRANLTFAGEYNKTDGLLYTDRKISALGRYYDDPLDSSYAFTQQLYEHRLIPGISDTGTPLVGRFGYDLLGLNADLAPSWQEAFGPYAEAYGGAPPGTPFNLGVTGIGGDPEADLKFDNNGNLIPIDFGTSTSITNSSGGNGYSLTDLSNLLTATQRYSAIVLGSFDISDNIRLFGEGWYTHSEGTNLRDQPEYKSGFFGAPGDPAGDIILSINNPFLSDAARAAIQDSIDNNPLSDQNLGYVGTQDYFYLGRANTDLVTGRVKGEVDVYRFVGGLDGNFDVGGNNWTWEIVANYGHSKTHSTIPTIIEQNFLNAVGAITADNPTGTPCLAGLPNSDAPTISETCSPLDLFGNGVASQEARDYVTGLATPTSVNQQFDATASLTGSLFKMPGGEVQFALGAEHRWEHETFDPSLIFHGGPDPDLTVDENGDGDPTDDFVQFGQTVPQSPIDAGFHTNEVFGELHVPLVGEDMHVPLMQALEIQAAGRYVDHSVSGGAFTWTLGGRWTVVPDLTIRGNFTHSIRSPSITEAEAPAQTYYDFATDPCDPQELANGPNPTARNQLPRSARGGGPRRDPDRELRFTV